MSYWGRVMIIVGACIIGFFLLYYLFHRLVHRFLKGFINKRFEGEPGLKYFKAEDFRYIKTKPITFKSDKTKLNGYIYYKGRLNYDKMIVFFHGFGAGHEAYTKEIVKLVRTTKLPVIAFDHTACGNSEGKKLGSLTQFLIDGYFFFQFIKEGREFTNTKFILVGHSMGGYVAGCLPNFVHNENIERVVLLAPVNSIIDIYAKYSLKSEFYLWHIERAEKRYYKQFANQKLLDNLKEHKLPTLIIHGLLDDVVSYEEQILPIVKYANEVEFIRPVIYDNKGHQVYLTSNAQDELDIMFRKLKKVRRSASKKKKQAFFDSIDYDAIGEDDEEVFSLINNFIKEEVNNG
ncbi:MAG: alpha/beta hydrolase family protein [Bacilli bacterium]|jgi:pimeloyl-ACP methyl ester carboxylesterase